MSGDSLSYESTTVSVANSMGHVEKLCLKFGATSVRFTKDYEGRRFRVEMMVKGLPLAVLVEWSGYAAVLVKQHPQKARSDREALYQQAERAAWRWAYYWLKLGFEGDAFKFQPKEAAFLAGFLGPNGQTLAEAVVPRLGEWNQFGGQRLLGLPAGE